MTQIRHGGSIETFARWLWNDEVSPAQVVELKVWNAEKLSWRERNLWRKLAETALFARYTPRRYDESVWIHGRQSGKSSRLATTCILYTAFCEEHVVASGERLSILSFSPVLRQNTFQLVAEKIRSIPELFALVESDNSAGGELRLSNGIDILEISSNPAYARGKTSILVVIDEAAFLHSDQEFTNNLTDLLESVRPSLVVKHGRLILLSSPGGQEGILYETWRDRALNPDVLVFRAASALLNTSIDVKLLERERKRFGESYYRREFLAEFTETSGTPFLDPDALARATAVGSRELGAAPADYVSSGLDLADRRDDCALAHATVRDFGGVRKVMVLSCRVWKPNAKTGHQVLTVLREMGEDCKRVGSARARGDQKSMSVAEQVLAAHGVSFTRVVTAGQGSEAAYRTFAALLNEDRIVLPDDPELLQQLRRLEQKAQDGNRFLVEGRRGAHDDVAVACVVAVAYAAEDLEASQEPMTQYLPLYTPLDDDGPAYEGLGHRYVPGTGGWRRL
jgi:hypothetical protein